ncbi:unnamed protein product [Orchesella dallaii]|uniref:Uncharacterized protein n=1 Tax=Orchesella dallaii TaxID=48710 RepID=A0ABP1S6J7_9HEXA
MSLANKYTEGKRKHLGGSFSYGLRMSCTVLTYNLSRYWLPDLFQDVNGVQPSLSWIKFKKRGILRRHHGKKKKKPKKISTFGFLKEKRGDEFYGEEPLTPGLDGEQLPNATNDLFIELQADDEKRSLIELKIRKQSESEDWLQERRSCITASNAGKLFKLRPTSDNTNFKTITITGFRVAATEYGKESEDLAITAYEVDQCFSKGFDESDF